MSKQRLVALCALFGAGCAPCAGGAGAGDGGSADGPRQSDGGEHHDGSRPTTPARVILFVGDGMGPAHEAAASLSAFGATELLALDSLEHRGEIVTAGPSGITDSAAAATAMASGELTFNGRLAIDRNGVPQMGLFELAAGRNMSRGIVTTATVSHATVAAFTSVNDDRYAYDEIAEYQTRVSQPTVMLGGGLANFSPTLIAELGAAGATLTYDANGLADRPASVERLVGLFADGQLPFVRDRTAGDGIPSLEDMTLAALDVLDRNPNGFVLVVEGARIDRASHDRDIDNAVAETLEFDRAIAATLEWASGREDITTIALADHETGGLDVSNWPSVSWRWGNHTGRRVGVRGSGPGTTALSGGVFDQRVVFALISALIEERDVALPSRVLVANGELSDLRFSAAVQDLASDFGADGQLDELRIDADAHGLAIGVAGGFSRTSSSLVVAIDRDFGSGTGAARFDRTSSPSTDPVDVLLARFELDLAHIAGFGAEFAAASVAGVESALDATWSGGGWRALGESDGRPLPAVGLPIVLGFDDGVRDGTLSANSGAELFISFEQLYPNGTVPPGSRIAVVAILTSVVGGTNSNQTLPSLSLVDGRVTAVCVIELDRDLDGQIDPVPVVTLSP